MKRMRAFVGVQVRGAIAGLVVVASGCGGDDGASTGLSGGSGSGATGSSGSSGSSGGTSSTSGGATTLGTSGATETGTSAGTSDASGSSSGTSEGTSTSTSGGVSTSGTTGDTTTGDGSCAAPGNLVVCDLGLDGSSPDHAFAALGVGCKGAPENTIPIANKAFKKFKNWNNPASWRVARVYGSAEDPDVPGEALFRAREGERFLIVSTGVIAAPDADGVVLEAKGSQYDNNNNSNDDADVMAAPLSPEVGSAGGQGGTPFLDCDGQNDCSDSIWPNWSLGNMDPNDQLSLAFEVTAPDGVGGFLFDLAFFSSEYPDFVGKKFNDMFIAWSTSEAYTGNVTFFEKQPLTVTALATAMESSGYTLDDPELFGTGFEGHGSTGWVTVEGPVVAGETFTFALAIMDMGDSNKATAALVDAWRWDCAGCVLPAVDPMCGEDGHPACCGVCVEEEDDPECGTPGHPECCPPPG